VVYALYLFRQGRPMRVNAWATPTLASHLKGVILRNRGPHEPTLPLQWLRNEWREAWGRAVPVSGLGLGCTLIHRRVLEQVRFRDREGRNHCDWWFATDCAERGFKQVAHLGVVCGHKTPDGIILWPTLEGYKIQNGKNKANQVHRRAGRQWQSTALPVGPTSAGLR
jgi:hypothetical protein